ncbi:hypothetical protein [Siphonobacter aquaeclarae]|uniref:Head domain of trimeric autotransporter adhesin n=1 Tax=Siphonobacter aquaeclarae TaxID=563176 RepID=A0A1G9KAQ2_9BACT|nr:hypothetical protein [Siphonobacter aquaeclarae]SDL46801.1 hypothetical protein SAMN04488090_0948 [Siphonobacter aquaeclarae]
MSKSFFVPGLILTGLLLSSSSFGQNWNYIRNTENGASPGSNNTVVGYQSGYYLTNTTTRNVFMGILSGFNAWRLNSSVIIGSRAGFNIRDGAYHILIGDEAGSEMEANNSVSWTPESANIYIGAIAGSSYGNRQGTGNVFVGHSTGTGGGQFSSSTILGNTAGMAGGGVLNTYLGFASGKRTQADRNTFIGSYAGGENNLGPDNVFVGANAGFQSGRLNAGPANVTGNVFVGSSAGFFNSGFENVYIGHRSGYGRDFISDGRSNVAVGHMSGLSVSSGSYNAILGNNAGQELTTGRFNTLLGSRAGWRLETGESNTMIGAEAGLTNRGSRNVLIGRLVAGYFNVVSNDNVFVGEEAALYNIGSQNVAIGRQAAWYQMGGSHNVVLGNVAGRSSHDPSQMNYSHVVIIGDSAGYNNHGDANVFLGRKSGLSNNTGTNNTYLGFAAAGVGNNAANLQNAAAIGANSVVGISNGFVLGDTTNTKVGIGTAYPNQRLTIRGNMNFLTASNLRFDNAPFLDINPERLALGGEKGEFPVEITSSLRYKIASENQWADYVFAPSFRKLPLKEVATFIQQNGHLPGIPSAKEVVLSGVDAAQMDAKLLAQIEQLTLHAIEQKSENDQLKAENKALKEQFSELLRRIEKLERK